MGITSALYTGVSGLKANSEAMNVIGNNIANVNTTGFKGGRTVFSDLLSTNSVGNHSQIGLGTQIQTIQNQFNQGSFATSQNETDLAIQGDSFFVLKNGANQAFSRAGAFTFDKTQTLVNPDGYQVMGYAVDKTTGKANITSVLGSIDEAAFTTAAPQATTVVQIAANFDSTAPALLTTTAVKMSAGVIDNAGLVPPADATVTLYDSIGTAVPSTITFTAAPIPVTVPPTLFSHSWTWSAASVAAPLVQLATGSLTFDPVTGALSGSPQTTQSVTLGGTSQQVAFDFTGMREGLAAAAVPPVAVSMGTPNFSTSLNMYDSLGNAHKATVNFSRDVTAGPPPVITANTWNFNVVIPEAILPAATPTITGTIEFNPDGTFKTQTGGTGIVASWPTTNGVDANPQTINFDFGKGLSTQFASASVISTQNQDGYAEGNLIKVNVDNQGFVNAVYSNGQTQKVAQIALAKFASVDGLSKIGGSLFEQTAQSGLLKMGTASTLSGNTILSKNLELSNVDLATELVNMIVTQRAYQANSKTITANDQLTQEAIQMVR